MQGFFYRYVRLYRPLITSLNDLLSDYDLSYSLWQVVFYVRNSGPCTLVEISKHFNIEKPSVTRMVHRLEEKAMVQQIPGKDKREKIIQITEVGEETYQTCRKKITELEYKIMKDIPEADQMAVFETLPKIKENIIELEEEKNE